jgi:hypothetical protein
VNDKLTQIKDLLACKIRVELDTSITKSLKDLKIKALKYDISALAAEIRSDVESMFDE